MVSYAIALGAGAVVYWLTRWQRNFAETAHKLTFAEYLRFEWPALVWGAAGGVGLYALYVYAGEHAMTVLGRVLPVMEGVELPAFNVVFAFLFGFIGKAFADRLPRIVNWFGANVRLPGVK
jgi:hypothetical protein